jgi:hypothetical protein
MECQKTLTAATKMMTAMEETGLDHDEQLAAVAIVEMLAKRSAPGLMFMPSLDQYRMPVAGLDVSQKRTATGL